MRSDPRTRQRDPEFWDKVENSSPENVQLGGVIRRLEGLCGGSSSFDWAESRRRSAEIVEKCRRQTPENSLLEDLADLLDGMEFEVGGAEHHLLNLAADPGRIYKVTHGDNFGCYTYFSPYDVDPLGKHFHGANNSDPVFYLQRWMLLNSLGEYQTRFEGFLDPQDGLHVPRICVSQPALKPGNPTLREIEMSLGVYGFEKISEDAFLDFEHHLLLTDAAPRNVRVIDNIPVPFDAIAEIASSEVIEWALGRRHR